MKVFTSHCESIYLIAIVFNGNTRMVLVGDNGAEMVSVKLAAEYVTDSLVSTKRFGAIRPSLWILFNTASFSTGAVETEAEPKKILCLCCFEGVLLSLLLERVGEDWR